MTRATKAATRCKRLASHFGASPALPAFALTKTIEMLILAKPRVPTMGAFAIVVTLAWAYLYQLEDVASDAAETASDAAEEIAE